MRPPHSLLFFRLNKPSFLSLSLQRSCSSLLIILVALLWTLSNSSLSFLYWGPTPRCSTPNGASQGQRREGQSPPCPCWPPLFSSERPFCFVFPSQPWTVTPDFTHHAHTASLSAVAVNSKYVVTGSRDESIQIYDMRKKVEHGALLQHNGKGYDKHQG